MSKIVISLGGSVIVPNEIDEKFLKEFAKVIKKFKRKHKFKIICGGGSTARKYAKAAKEGKVSEKKIHEIGIVATHLNAKLVAALIDGKFSVEHPEKIGKMKGLIVSGGYKPGWTTDTDAAIIAKTWKADMLINITDVKGLYDKNPKKHKNAKFIPTIHWEDFLKMAEKVKIKPGVHFVFDPLASKICAKSKIKTIIISKDVKNFENLLAGKQFTGTVIV